MFQAVGRQCHDGVSPVISLNMKIWPNECPELCLIKQAPISPLGLEIFLSGGMRIQKPEEGARESPAPKANS